MREEIMEKKVAGCLYILLQSTIFFTVIAATKAEMKTQKKPLRSVFVTGAVLTRGLTYETDLISH